jgi:hypothetical protein
VDYPSIWPTGALTEANLDVTPESIAILRAWQASTPLSPYSNNPIGMPAGVLGAKRYAGTSYAAFTSLPQFYKAFASFCESYDGGKLWSALKAQHPYSAAWRVISGLGWPGSDTETDYPSALLDLTTEAYRASVKAADPADRKTSGLVGIDAHVKAQVIEQARAVSQAAQALNLAGGVTARAMKRGK